MCVLVSREAPNFTAGAVFPDGSLGNVSLSDYRGQKVILFFYPMDFTFVCPTELIAFSDAYSQFQSAQTALLGCSVDSQYSHYAWLNTPRKQGGLGGLKYPLISDFDKKISADYGVLLPAGMALRGLFLIDQQGIVRHQLVNDLPLGRSVDEALRIVQALDFFQKNGEVCPANWHSGDSGIKPDIKDSQEYFQSHD